MNNKFILSSILGFGILTLSTAPAQALTINRNFLPAGTPLPFGLVAGSPSTNAAGGGNLIDIFNTAADYWEAAILDDHTVTINFGWLDFTSIPTYEFNRGVATSLEGVFPPNNSLVGFNNNDFVAWFLDPTPEQNEEYQQYTETVADLGGGEVNVGRVYTDPTGDAVNRNDMLSVAIHEIGHALGFFSDEPTFGIVGNPQLTIPELIITEPRPLAGTVIPTTSFAGGHIDGMSIPTTSMQAALNPQDPQSLWAFSSRYLLSGIDILAIAETNNFSQLDLDPRLPVPESSSLLGLLGLGLLGIGACLKKPYFHK